MQTFVGNHAICRSERRGIRGLKRTKSHMESKLDRLLRRLAAAVATGDKAAMKEIREEAMQYRDRLEAAINQAGASPAAKEEAQKQLERLDAATAEAEAAILNESTAPATGPSRDPLVP